MGKKEFPKIEGNFKPKDLDLGPSVGGGIREKISGVSSRAFGIIKFILGVCLLPFVYSSSASFLSEFNLIEKSLQACFWTGVISLLIVYLFVLEPAIIYTKGQKLLELFFSFFKPLVKVAPYLLPIYTILLFILYWPFSLISQSPAVIKVFIFIFGFSIAFHLIYSAKTMRSKQGDFLKSNYIFGFSFIYILNLMLLAMCLNCIFKEFSFVNFFNTSFQIAKGILSAVFKQLFVP